jgi:3-oxoacyl-[acyl-carrier protein] reductase
VNTLSGNTAIVVGASRRLAHGIARAFADATATAVAVSLTAAAFSQPANPSATIHVDVADAAEATAAANLLDRYEREFVILLGRASPYMRPLHCLMWETFSIQLETHVRITFPWLREALLKPLRLGSRVIVISSSAALNATGSSVSGGFAGAKAT